MNLTQNDRLNQVTAETLVVGVDIGSQEHFARAFDWRGLSSAKGPSDSAIQKLDFSHFFAGWKRW